MKMKALLSLLTVAFTLSLLAPEVSAAPASNDQASSVSATQLGKPPGVPPGPPDDVVTGKDKPKKTKKDKKNDDKDGDPNDGNAGGGNDN